MTRAKYGPRRIGVPDGRDDAGLEPFRRTTENVQESARALFLATVARHVSAVLHTLDGVPARCVAGRLQDAEPD